MTFTQKIITTIQNNQSETAFQLIDHEIDDALNSHDIERCFEIADEFSQIGFVQYGLYVCDKVLKYEEIDEFKLLKSEMLIDDNQVEEAIDILLSIPNTSECYLSSLLVVSDAYHLIDLDEVAYQKLLLAKSLAPDELIIDLAIYELAYMMGNNKVALNALKNVENSNVISDLDFAKKMAKVLFSLGEFEEGIQYLDDLSENEHDLESLFELGLAYYQIEEMERSIKRFEQLVNMDPDFYSVYPFIGRAAITLGDVNKGIVALEKAIEFLPYQEEIYVTLYQQYAQLKQSQKMNAILEKAKEHQVESALLTFYESNQLFDLGDFDGVVALCERFIEQTEDHPLIFWMLAKAYAELEEDADALENFENAYVGLETQVEFLYDYAMFCRNIGKIDEMKRIFNLIKQLEPNALIELEEEML